MNAQLKNLIQVMEEEKNFLDDFGNATDQLRISLYQKQWTALESALKRLDTMSKGLEELERKRSSLSKKCADFSSVTELLEALEPEEKQRFLVIKHQIKAQILRLRTRLKTVFSYAEKHHRLGRELLEELLPSTRGCLYDKRGRGDRPGRDALVLSRHF